LNDIHGELSQFNKIKNNYNEIINSEDKIQKLNNEIKYINGKLDEFKAAYQHMKSLNIDILLGTVPNLPFKSENKEDLIKHAGNLSPEAEIRGLRRVIKILFQEYDILEKELADVKKSSKNVKP
jgi:prefoldin subunit 5